MSRSLTGSERWFCIVIKLENHESEELAREQKIGMTRFELATPATRTRCATKLRYIPIFWFWFCSAPTVLPLAKMILNHFSSWILLSLEPVVPSALAVVTSVLTYLGYTLSQNSLGRVKLRYIPIVVFYLLILMFYMISVFIIKINQLSTFQLYYTYKIFKRVLTYLFFIIKILIKELRKFV